MAFMFSRRRLASGAVPVFATMFAAGEPGIWLDPSDLTTLFQDSAGTTPVTAPGDPVSIALDKSQNLTMGSELITNGDFADGSTGWTITAAGANTISVANGAFTLTTTGSADTATITHAWLGAAANGKTYEISFEVLTGSSGTIKISTLGINNTIGEHSFSATVGVKTFRLVAATALTIGFSRVTGQTATAIITNISVKKIAGNHARQTTAASRPTYQVDASGRGYLSFDGVDDFLVTPTITPGTNKVQVFAGVRKLSDAAQGAVAELSASTAANNGTMLLAAPDGASATFAFDSKGTVQTDAVATGQTAPLTAVLAGLGDVSGDSAILRVNGAVADTDTGDQGTGNYLAYPIYIGRRGGTTLPLNGRIYSLAARFGPGLTASVISRAESQTAAKTGVAL